MPLLWNSETGRLENVPENDVTVGVGSGRLSFRKGVRIPVVGPDGREGTIAAEDSGSAFQNGWRYQPGEEVKARTMAGIEAGRAEAYDKSGTAFAAGALRGATLGLSDLAIGAVDKEAGQQIRERSPIASLAGEITGSIAALASPLTPAAQVAKLGAATTKAATGAIAATSRAGKIVSELGGAAIGSAVEGAAYGAGMLLTEAALGDPKLTASQVASTVGISSVMGAGLGVVGKGVSQAWNRWKASASNPAALMSEGYGKATAKLFGLTGKSEEEFVNVFERQNANGRSEIAHYAANPDELYSRGLTAIQSLDEAGKAAAKTTGQVRTGAIGAENAQGAISKAQVKGGTDIMEKLDETANTLRSSENFKKSVANDVAQVSEDLNAKLVAAETPEAVFQSVHEARMQLDGFTKALRSEGTYEAKQTMEKVKELRDTIQTHLRDANIYGESAKTFAEGDALFSKYLTAKENFKDQFMASKYVAGAGKQKELSPGKVKGFFRRPDAESMAFKSETISELEKSANEMAAYAAKNGTDFGIDLGKISAEIDAVKRLRASELALSGVESFTGKSLSGAVAGMAIGGLGGLVSDDIGAGTTTALALAGIAAANPRMAVKYLSKIERLQNEFGQRTDNALTRLLSLPRKGTLDTVSASGAIKRDALMQMVKTLQPDDAAPVKHDDALESLSPYLTDPSLIDDRMVRANPHLDGVAPDTYAAMVNQTHAAIAFMRDKWPNKGTSDAIFATPGSLSASERHTMEAYALGAFQPGAMVSQLERGQIDPRTVEAVRAVHPEMFEDIKRRLIEKIPEAKNIPYSKKLAIGAAFGIPTTAGLVHVGAIQQALATQVQQPPQQASGGGDFSTRAKSERTGSMQVAMR